MSSNADLSDIVAANDEPSLQAFRKFSIGFPNEDTVQSQQQDAVNQVPLQLLRRVSETVTESILSSLEPEKQCLLAGQSSSHVQPSTSPTSPTSASPPPALTLATTARAHSDRQHRPMPPPRSHGHFHLRHKKNDAEAKHSIQQEHQDKELEREQEREQWLANNKALGQSDNMTQTSSPTSTMQGTQSETPTSPSHTKLDIQKFSEDHNNSSAGGGNSSGDATQSPATIILTPTSLNLTNTMQNVAGNNSNNGGFSNNGTGYPGHGVEYKGPKWWLHLVHHWPLLSEHVALLTIFLGLWSMLWVLLPDYAPPTTAIMRLVLLFVGAQIIGKLVMFLNLPDMLGMLVVGVVYTNVGFANFDGYERLELFLRELALVNIMLLAGVSLDGGAFRRLWLMVMRLTLMPTIAEVAVITVLAYYILGMPWLWGLGLGFIITAVSPNVVVTVMLKLKEERLGLNSGIHTLIYAMTTCNDVVSIFLFGVVLTVIFSTNSVTQQVLQGPIGIGIGLVFGYLYGMMLQYLPSRNAVYANSLRFVLTVLGGTIAVMGSRAIGYTSAGALGCISMAFIGSIGWKREEHKLTPEQLQASHIASVPKRLDVLWKFLKPVSFALIGKEVNFAVLEGHVIGYGALLVILGSLFRLAFAYLSTYGGNLSRSERAYITISGFPKATVQAALGPVALDLARFLGASETQVALANKVLIISVLAIIFTAPLGSILMLRLAPVWLKRGDAVDTTESPTTPDADLPGNLISREDTNVNNSIKHLPNQA